MPISKSERPTVHFVRRPLSYLVTLGANEVVLFGVVGALDVLGAHAALLAVLLQRTNMTC